MSDESTTKTTVVIAVWGGYATSRLADAVQSIRDQDSPVAIVVIDNASNADLPDLADLTPIRCPERISLGSARNLGLSLVETQYVIFWDADDVMLPGSVAYMEQQLDRDVGLVAVGLAIIEQETGQRHRWPRRWLGALTRLPRLLALLDCVWSVFPTTGATVIRTEVARDAGGFAEAGSGEDWCLGVALLARGRVGWSERPGRLYAQRPESVWATHSSVRHQFEHAEVVRARMRSDPALPSALRRLLPALAVAQSAAILAHVAVRQLRRAFSGARAG